MRNYETEKQFKEIAINHAIDQSGKKMRVVFRHASHDMKVGEAILDTSKIRAITVEHRKYYANERYSSIENSTKESMEEKR
jgi:hypothetical protein